MASTQLHMGKCSNVSEDDCEIGIHYITIIIITTIIVTIIIIIQTKNHHHHPLQEIEALTCTALRETGRNHWSLHIQSQPQPSMMVEIIYMMRW